MKNKTFHSLRKAALGICLALTLMISASGCVYVVVAGVGLLGGYVVSPDTVEGILSGHEQATVWDAAIEIISIMGVIEERNEVAGTLIAKIQGTRVTVTVMRMSQNATQVTVKARKAFLPKIRIAQEVYIKIVQYVNE